MNKFKEKLNIDIIILLLLIVIAITSSVIVSKKYDATQLVVLWVVVILLYIRMRMSKNILKASASITFMLYMTSLFTFIVMNAEGRILEPFFVGIGLYSLFIANTYSTKYYQIHLRSRWLWGVVFAFIHSVIRLSLYMYSEVYWLSESVGFLMTISLIALWRLWAVSRIKEPLNLTIEEYNNFIVMRTSEMLNTKTMMWGNVSTTANKDALPIIGNMLAKAHKAGKKLAVITPGPNVTYEEYISLDNFIDGEYLLILSTDDDYIEERGVRN